MATAPYPQLRALTLVLGGVRSGKSAFAEGLLSGIRNRTYVATARILDESMRSRVEEHRARREGGWTTVEAPLDLPAALRDLPGGGDAVLVDSLGMWSTNLLLEEHDVDAAGDSLLESLAAMSSPVVVVSDEVGLGGVAANSLARKFADCHGLLNQKIAGHADRVYLVVAGIPTLLKDAADRNQQVRS